MLKLYRFVVSEVCFAAISLEDNPEYSVQADKFKTLWRVMWRFLKRQAN